MIILKKNFVRRAGLLGTSAVAIAGVLVLGNPAAAQTAYSEINFPASGDATIVLVSGSGGSALPLNTNFSTDSGAAGALSTYTQRSLSVQTLFTDSSTLRTIASVVNNTGGPSGILAQRSGSGTSPANISSNFIFTRALGNVAAPASGGGTFDLRLLSTANSAGSLITQYLGREGSGDGAVSAMAGITSQFVGVDYVGQSAADLAVDLNVILARTALNTATTLMAGAVPVSYANTAAGGSSTITVDGADVDMASSGGIGLNTMQVTQDGSIAIGNSGSSGSFAQVSGSRVAVEAQATAESLSSPITLNSNAIGAEFVGNTSTSVFESAASGANGTNAFTGTVAITNAQVNRETTANSSGVNAQVSSSSIVADITYNGIGSGGSDFNATSLTNSLSVSGTAEDRQSVSASAIGNQAGAINSAGQVETAGNLIQFTNNTVNLTGKTGAAAGIDSSGSTSIASGDLVINSVQANASGAGVEALVSGSGVQAAVDLLTTTGSVTANYNAVTSQVAGNAAGNLIDVAANNVDARMAVMGTQQNSGSSIEAVTSGSGVTVGIGNVSGSTTDIVALRSGNTDVVGSIAASNNFLAATAQGNVQQNSVAVAAANTLAAAQVLSLAAVTATDVDVDAGLVAGNRQSNAASAVTAAVSGGGVLVNITDQTGGNVGTRVELGAATVALSSNDISALAQGNSGTASVEVTGGANLALSAAAVNGQDNDATSAISASISGSDVQLTALSLSGSSVTLADNRISASATANTVSTLAQVSGGNVVNGPASGATILVANAQDNGAGVSGSVSSSDVGLLIGAASSGSLASSLSGSTSYIYTANASGDTTATDSNTSTNSRSLILQDIVTVAGATLAVNSATILGSAAGNAANNVSALSGTLLGGSAAVRGTLANNQANSGAIVAGVSGSRVGLLLEGQTNTLTTTDALSRTVATQNLNIYDSVSVPIDLTVASASVTDTVTRTLAGSITSISGGSTSVSAATIAAQATANAAANSATISGTTVRVATPDLQSVGSTQSNSGSVSSTVSGSQVGIATGNISGASTASISMTLGAYAEPTNGSEIAIAEADATNINSASGSMTTVGVQSHTANVLGSRMFAASTGNDSENELVFVATSGAPVSGQSTGTVGNNQDNAGSGSAAVSAANFGLVMGTLTATQVATASGSATATLTSNTGEFGSGSSASASGGTATASGSATATAAVTGQSGGTVAVTSNLLSAASTGNRVANTVDVTGSATLTDLLFRIDNSSGGNGQSNSGAQSGSLSGVQVGVAMGNVLASGSATTIQTATLTALARDTTRDISEGSGGDTVLTATATGNTVTASGSASATFTATGVSGATNTTSDNTLQAMAYGNDAENSITAGATAISTNSATASLLSSVNGQSNTSSGSLTASATGLDVGTMLSNVTASGIVAVTLNASGSVLAQTNELDDQATKSATAALTVNSSGSASLALSATGVGGLTDTISNNSLSATTYGNSAVNSIALTGTTLAGTSSGSSSTSLMQNSNQTSNAAQTASLNAVDLGLVLGNVLASGLVSIEGTASGSATATTVSGDDTDVGTTETENYQAIATTTSTVGVTATGSATAMGIAGSTVTVAGNALGASNSGNVASNSILATSTSLRDLAVTNANTQTASGALMSTVGASGSAVQLGINVGNVTATISGGATAKLTASSTAMAVNDGTSPTGLSGSLVDTSINVGSATLTTSASATVGGVSATATGLANSVFSVTSNRVSALNLQNDAANLVSLGASVLGASGSVTGVTQTNSQSNSGGATATVQALELGVVVGNVTATATSSTSGSASPDSNIDPDFISSATNSATAIGMTGVTATVGGTASDMQLVRAQSIGNNAVNEILTSSTISTTAPTAPLLDQWNSQTNTANMTARVGDAAGNGVLVGVSVGNVESSATGQSANASGIVNSTTTVAFNQVDALGIANNATNVIDVSNSNTLSGTSASVNTLRNTTTQFANASTISGYIENLDLGVFLGTVTYNGGSSTLVGISDSTMSVADNMVAAAAYGNNADNKIVVNAQIAGASTTPLSTLLGEASGNTQVNAATRAASVQDVDLGIFVAGVEEDDGILNSTLSVSRNLLAAESFGNSATSTTSIETANQLFASSILTRNDQSNGTGSGSSSLSGINVGVNLGFMNSGDGFDGGSVIVSDNNLVSRSLGNLADSRTLVSGGNTLTGVSGSSIFTDNDQTNGSNLTATADSISIGVEVGQSGSATTAALRGTPVTVSGNSLTIAAEANTANNVASASAQTISNDSTTSNLVRVRNAQSSSGTTTASGSAVNIGLQVASITGDGVINAAIVVGNNNVAAEASGNTATNSVVVNASNTFNGSSDVDEDALVTNSQNNSAGSVTASLTTVRIGLDSGASGAADVSGGTVSVDGNTVTAAARSNVATNGLRLEAQTIGQSGSGVQAAVTNSQINSSAGTATLASTRIGVMPTTTGALNVNNMTAAVTNNALNAVAGGNTATNALNAGASATIASVGSGYSYRLLNGQSNTADMAATATDTRIGSWSNGGNNTGTQTTVTVSFNSLNVTAYGNSANSALNVTALNGNLNGAQSSVQNSQSSSANISATVSGALVGTGFNASTGGMSTVFGNSINATAVGNTANTSIGLNK